MKVALKLAIGLTAFLVVLAATIISSSRRQDRQKETAEEVRQRQVTELQAAQAQQAFTERTAELTRERNQEARERKEERSRQLAAEAEREREKRLPCEGGHCVMISVQSVSSAYISSKDENGYEQTHGSPLERLTVSVGGETPGDGLVVAGQTFEGHGATADLLCLQNCFILREGSIHYTGIGAWKTHWTQCSSQYGDCSDYQNLPYLSIANAKWQILELCVRPGLCRAMSTVNARE